MRYEAASLTPTFSGKEVDEERGGGALRKSGNSLSGTAFVRPTVRGAPGCAQPLPGVALWAMERQFRRVKAHRHLRLLREALRATSTFTHAAASFQDPRHRLNFN
jgi:hypothetical protein